MRIAPCAAILLATFVVTSAASAQEQEPRSLPAHEPHASFQGFGGIGLGGSAANVHPTFGGAIVGDLTRNVQLVGEFGRIGDILPSRTETLLAFSPVDVSVSAFYGSGGVRLSGGSSGVRPYAEATAGIARLTPQVSGIGSGLGGVLTNIGLSMLNTTAPLATLGGGVTFQGGPLVADIGYRYRQVFSSTWVDALALGGRLSSNEVRFGLGVRF